MSLRGGGVALQRSEETLLCVQREIVGFLSLMQLKQILNECLVEMQRAGGLSRFWINDHHTHHQIIRITWDDPHTNFYFE